MSEKTKITPCTYASLAAGLDIGKQTADTIIAKFPGGEDHQREAASSLKAQISIRERFGLERQHLEDFESGFTVGLRKRLGEHALDCIVKSPGIANGDWRGV
jgi:hypothetical protein